MTKKEKEMFKFIRKAYKNFVFVRTLRNEKNNLIAGLARLNNMESIILNLESMIPTSTGDLAYKIQENRSQCILCIKRIDNVLSAAAEKQNEYINGLMEYMLMDVEKYTNDTTSLTSHITETVNNIKSKYSLQLS